MLHQLYDAIVRAIGDQHNQFLSGGLVLMILGAVAAYARRLPARLYFWLQSRFIITLDITNEDPAFYWLAGWLSMQPYAYRARNLSVTTYRDHYGSIRAGTSGSPDITQTPNASQEERRLPEIILTPAPGHHVFFYKRRPIWLVRNRESGQKGENSGMFSLFNKESFQIRIIARKQATARALVEEARKLAITERKTRTDIFVLTYDNFRQVETCDPRPLCSVFLPDGQVDYVLGDLKEFLASKEWYIQRGIPWHRGYYFHGISGTGKTSLIKALAGELRLNIYIINLSARGLDDRQLQYALSSLPPSSIILLEDIDAAFKQRQKDEDTDNSVSFSGLLNALDGAASREGWLVFMTTNHPERVDEALTRPGRADVHLRFTYATAGQAAAMFLAFFPEATQAETFGEIVGSRQMKMAAVQQHLLLHRDSPVEALTAMELPLAEVEEVA